MVGGEIAAVGCVQGTSQSVHSAGADKCQVKLNNMDDGVIPFYPKGGGNTFPSQITLPLPHGGAPSRRSTVLDGTDEL